MLKFVKIFNYDNISKFQYPVNPESSYIMVFSVRNLSFFLSSTSSTSFCSLSNREFSSLSKLVRGS